VIFLFSALVETIDWTSTVQMTLGAGTRWVNLYHGQENMALTIASLLPWVSWFLIGALVLKFIGSLLLIIGWKVRFGAACLALFLIPVTLIMHDFWNQPGTNQSLEMIMFLKNLAILGGLMVVIAFGKGPIKDAVAKSE
jgi:uncharacterized membrane protein YphA (DoxX/SURF4 family)